jgi:hypothetical protein
MHPTPEPGILFYFGIRSLIYKLDTTMRASSSEYENEHMFLFLQIIDASKLNETQFIRLANVYLQSPPQMARSIGKSV